MLDDEEPTQGAGPCIEEWGLVDEETAGTLHGILDTTEYNYADLLVEHGELEVFMRVFIGLDCLRLVEVRVRGCKEKAERVKRLFDEPEFTRIALEGECIEIAAPADIRVRVERALAAVGLAPPLRVLAYRLVRRLVLE